MKAKDLFLAAIRLFGVWMLVQCIDEGLFYFDKIKGYYAGASSYSENVYLAHFIVDLVVGLALLICGRELTNVLAWPSDRAGPNKCEQCGYDLRGGHDKCPECGTPVEQKSLK